jgi:catechol 2,3-dioxygenase-like lactoylglutathione lyase family enzyme
MIERLHHVQITVPTDDEPQARAFYIDLLGLREIEKPDALKSRGGFWLEIAGQELHVSIEDGVDRNATKAHIAYQVSDLGAWKLKLTAAGCTVLESVPIPGFDRFETRDPFGNRLEMIRTLEGENTVQHAF